MWNYSLGMGTVHTHESSLSPLRHVMTNPNVREAADVFLNFSDFLLPGMKFTKNTKT